MRLELRLEPQQTSDPEDFYNDNPRHKTNILGEDVTYVLCPRVQFKRWEKPTELGYEEDQRIFVAKSLHPAQIPFVALALFYQGLPRAELEARLGEDTFKGLTHEQIRRLIMQTALQVARGYLRAPEMADLIERHKGEAWYNSEDGQTLREIATTPQNTAIETITQQQKDSLDHYVKTMGEYFNAHQRNKWVKRSKAMLTAAKRHSWIDRNMDAYIVGADRVLDEILNDNKLVEKIPELAQVTRQLTDIQEPTEVIADPTVSRLLYLCDEATARRKQKAVEFKGNGPEKGSNIVLIRTGRFFEALNTRLCQIVLNQKRAIEEKVLQIEGPNYQKLLTDGAQKLQVTVPHPEKVRDTIRQGITELSLVATGAANDDLSLARALQARETLRILGIPTNDVDQFIKGYQMAQTQRIAATAPPLLLG